jgi:hypothetical protein
MRRFKVIDRKGEIIKDKYRVVRTLPRYLGRAATYYKLYCLECGFAFKIRADYLNAGKVSCPECRKREASMVGERVGKLVVKEQVPQPSHLKPDSCLYYRCKCDCGREAILASRSLRGSADGTRKPHNTSCGKCNGRRKRGTPRAE